MFIEAAESAEDAVQGALRTCADNAHLHVRLGWAH
jgi:hypothetical protein